MPGPLSDTLWKPQIVVSASAVFLALALFIYTQQKPSPQSSKKVGVKKSNLDDEFKYTLEGTKSPWKVKSLWIYPLKSARGIEVDHIDVLKTGLQYDRQFMLAEWQEDAKTGKAGWVFCTQRRNPKMALIYCDLYPDPTSATGGSLHVSFPSGKRRASFDVPLSSTFPGIESLPLVSASIWQDTPLSHDLGSMYEKELEQLREYMGARGRITLLRASESNLREVHRCAPKKEDLGYQSVIGFADAYPLHLLNLSSVRELNGRVKSTIEDLSVRRFRGNIIIEGPEAFNEDDWKVLEIGGQKYHAACRTVRCKLPNVDPETGVRNPNEPDVTMRKYRVIDAGHKTGACMGLQLVPSETHGSVKVGDEVKVVERGEHFYINFN